MRLPRIYRMRSSSIFSPFGRSADLLKPSFCVEPSAFGYQAKTPRQVRTRTYFPEDNSGFRLAANSRVLLQLCGGNSKEGKLMQLSFIFIGGHGTRPAKPAKKTMRADRARPMPKFDASNDLFSQDCRASSIFDAQNMLEEKNFGPAAPKALASSGGDAVMQKVRGLLLQFGPMKPFEIKKRLPPDAVRVADVYWKDGTRLFAKKMADRVGPKDYFYPIGRGYYAAGIR
ncbi:hypothetical protein [Methylobacterium sp. D48H]